ncbi:hypothetical protein NGRA_1360 [Nosema granulosis]|uniref:Splicing factor 3A subunit 1 conserved domain-containing protein n=1 Tax=Nosema granulosis TaxID=83296 RepID=A0A9P6KZN0_9MICR|nr:hypothetical protein NGRA_1360 [Nosema granulosis]
MVFSVLFDIEEDIKEEIIKQVIDKTTVNSKYLEITKAYQRAYLQLSTNKQYNFFKHRKTVTRYIDFKLISTVSHSKPYYKFTDGKYILISSRKCPICGKTIPEEEIEDHIKLELNKQNKVIVILDSSLKKDNTRFEYDSCTVKEIKKDIYDKIGVSVSKLEVLRAEEVLGNNTILQNETVIVKQKRRSNK